VTLSAADRLDILDVLTRADAAAGARDASAYLALFTDDAALDGDQGTYHGREALRRGLAEVWGAEPAGTLHLTLNPVIDADSVSSAAAVARSVLLIIAPGTPPALVAAAHITQHLRRGAEGWRITRRSVKK
jgi:ketosteroid isomerase-like protein